MKKYYIVSRNYTRKLTGIKLYEIIDDRKTAYDRMLAIAQDKLTMLHKNKKGMEYDLIEDPVNDIIVIRSKNPDGTYEMYKKYKSVEFKEYPPTINSNEYWIIKGVEIYHSTKSSNLRLNDWMGYLTTVKDLRNAILWIEHVNYETF